MPQSLEVVTPRLLLAQVCVDAHVSGRAGEAFVLPVWNVFVGVRVNVFFGKAEIDDMDDLVLFRRGAAYQEILGFHVSANIKKKQKITEALTSDTRIITISDSKPMQTKFSTCVTYIYILTRIKLHCYFFTDFTKEIRDFLGFHYNPTIIYVLVF